MTEPLIDVHSGELYAQAHGGDGVITLKLTGTADAVSRPALNNLLGRLHNECNRAEARKVVVDLHDLEFMNSSCFKSFITWIVAVRRLPEAQHYRIRFVSNAALHWQKRSLHAISYFGGELVTVEST